MRILLYALLSVTALGCKGDKDGSDTNGGVDSSDSADSEAWDSDEDGYDETVDCDDRDAAIHPDATEVCDGVDNDCDDQTDEAGADGETTWYVDGDGDGYGDADSGTTSCDPPENGVVTGGDCNDDDTAYHPGAAEDDCNDPNDYNCDGSVGYEDADADGFTACTDCDDAAPTTYPDAEELCDSVDNDCDDTIDEDAVDATTWYTDSDEDGYGDPEGFVDGCTQPEGAVADSTDCDDSDATVSPGADELCDERDNDCDGDIDEDGALDESTWYRDADDDGYGDEADTATACSAPGGYIAYGGDCDDTDAAYNPGATESCTEDIDYNCDGSVGYADSDGDGFAACEECDDADGAVNPDADELCDAVDNNCDGSIDEDSAVDASTWYADLDADAFGDASDAVSACSQPASYVADNTDCDDSAVDINPLATELCDSADNDCDGTVDEEDAADAATWYTDGDGDGYGDDSSGITACTAPGDTIAYGGDCDDEEAAINPDADEACNSLDDDCDGTIDEDATDLSTYYADTDSDGFGDATSTLEACSLPSGYSDDDSDCDDGDGDINPDADESCNSVDDNCDGEVDETGALGGDTWYADADGDGFGDAADSVEACDTPTGYVADNTDCDDTDLGINPGADEVCNTYDDNCDGEVDETGTADAGTWYADSDDDGFGDPSDSVESCTQPSGYVKLETDCDDADAAINPDATELCNDVDDNCDGTVDDDAVDGLSWYNDADDDGFGDADTTTMACDQPTGFVADDTDCDDGSDAIYPGADETCNSVDDDCDGTADDDAIDADTWYRDADRDGFGNPARTQEKCTKPGGWVSDNTDCDDRASTVYPGADETCNSTDDDCDGDTDEDATDSSDWYADSDGDGYGDATMVEEACDAPTGYVSNTTDCDDSASSIYPGADETCNGLDDDCNETVDDDASDAATWYKDSDSDTFGDSSRSKVECDLPTGYVADDEDCDDANDAVNPDADEVCNSLDDDCDGEVDIGASDGDTWYSDSDSDGFGDPSTTIDACDMPTGYLSDNTDCDDGDADVNPDATELCNSIDDDCNGTVDDGSASGTLWYADSDDDGYGDGDSSTVACDLPAGYTADDTDCDDSADTVFPGADELCNDTDDDCDGTADEGAIDPTTWYVDADADGHGVPGSTASACDMPSGYASDDEDCDDADGSTYPGAPEVCGDGLINDCDGSVSAAFDECEISGTVAVTDGWATFYGVNADDRAGFSVGAAGDVNGDGVGDVLVGANHYNSTYGAAFLALGPITGDLSLADADGEMDGVVSSGEAGQAVATAGDLDDDGYDDMLVTAPRSLVGTVKRAGYSYVVHGPLSGALSLSAADASYSGGSLGDVSGRSISSAGDWNEDGELDIAIGASGEESTTGRYAGAAYVVAGPLSGTNKLSSSYAKFTGEAGNDYVGRSLVAGEDVDGDGTPDLLTGAFGESTIGTSAGAAYLVLGPTSGTFSLSDADAKLTGEKTGDYAGRAVGWAGDADGDGLTDLAVGSMGNDKAAGSAGAVYVLLGAPSGTSSLSTSDIMITGAAKKDYLGVSVAWAGDVDGDGEADLVMGAYGEATGGTTAGAAYLLYGPPATGTSSVSSADLKMTGLAAGDTAGWCVAGAGDVNGDGRDDFLVSAYLDDTVAADAGAAYLFGYGY